MRRILLVLFVVCLPISLFAQERIGINPGTLMTWRSFDWIGLRYTGIYEFDSLSFQEGIHFPNGGWFDSLYVQVQTSEDTNDWTSVTNLVINPPYAGNNGVNYETYGMSFTPIIGHGIRIAGIPGGDSTFISVGELRVFGSLIDPLPIQLAYFTGTVVVNSILLTWGTTSETNNYGFEVERDGLIISFVAGWGTTNEPHDYSFTDRSPNKRLHSYRLKQIDLDGSLWWSNTIRVRLLSLVSN